MLFHRLMSVTSVGDEDMKCAPFTYVRRTLADPAPMLFVTTVGAAGSAGPGPPQPKLLHDGVSKAVDGAAADVRKYVQKTHVEQLSVSAGMWPPGARHASEHRRQMRSRVQAGRFA